MSPNNVWFKLYKKLTENVHGTQLGHCNRIPITLVITELISYLSPDTKVRYVGFCIVDGKMVNQVKECQLLDEKVNHFQAIVRDENIELFL